MRGILGKFGWQNSHGNTEKVDFAGYPGKNPALLGLCPAACGIPSRERRFPDTPQCFVGRCPCQRLRLGVPIARHEGRGGSPLVLPRAGGERVPCRLCQRLPETSFGVCPFDTAPAPDFWLVRSFGFSGREFHKNSLHFRCAVSFRQLKESL